MRKVHWFLVLALSVAMASAAWAAPDCDSARKAEKASVKSAEVVKSHEAESAHCLFCDFVAELKAQSENVTFTTVEDEHGVTVVFAGNTKDDVEMAQAVASKAYSMMSAPAYCNVSRAKMASKSCHGCAEGLTAFSGATVTFEETEVGATAAVQADDEEQVEQLYAFFRNLNPVDDKAGE